MTPTHEPVDSIVAVDIGNTRLKYGVFQTGNIEPISILAQDALALDPDEVFAWAPQGATWKISSVCEPLRKKFCEALARVRPRESVALLTFRDFAPLQVGTAQPEKTGPDRIAAAAAANYLRHDGQTAIVVDIGTAMKVDFIDERGVFHGGAIGPGWGVSARALHDFTDRLPLIDVRTLDEAPNALGKDTESALRSGLFWGAVGGVKELIARLAVNLPACPFVAVTGGGGRLISPYLDDWNASYLPHLVLQGIFLAKASA